MDMTVATDDYQAGRTKAAEIALGAGLNAAITRSIANAQDPKVSDDFRKGFRDYLSNDNGDYGRDALRMTLRNV